MSVIIKRVKPREFRVNDKPVYIYVNPAHVTFSAIGLNRTEQKVWTQFWRVIQKEFKQ